MSDDDESVSDNSQYSNSIRDVDETEEIESKSIRTDHVPKILTYNCLFAYAIERIKRIESGAMLWPPIILKIVDAWYNNPIKECQKYINEKDLVMIELMLNVP